MLRTARTIVARSSLLLALLVALALPSCKRSYRVGEYVLVEWQEVPEYPAYIIEAKGGGKYRVHYDGMDSRWDEDVTIDRIKGVATGHVEPPPPPAKVRRLTERLAPAQASSAAPLAPYKVGDHVKVRWRGSKYDATVRGVVANDRFLVHYDGYEDAWDETVSVDRIIGKR